MDDNALPNEVQVDRINLNDQTVEGLKHRSKQVFSVQYHPEASPGPTTRSRFPAFSRHGR